MDGDDKHHSAQPSATGSSSHPPQVRSRITVVCAECKRLKLKCDRRTPCGSCDKRGTVVRCIYSPAAAEKVDLHSLNNRLIQVEQWMQAQQDSGGPGPFSSGPTSSSSHAHNNNHNCAPGPPPPAMGLAIPLEALHTAFLAPLALPLPAIPAPRPSSSARSSASANNVDLTPSPALLALLPPPAHLPGALAAGHAALSSSSTFGQAGLGGAPFPFAWFEGRVYAFVAELQSAASQSTFPSSYPQQQAKKDKDARRRAREEKERNRERARAIFSGGSAQHNLDLTLAGYNARFGAAVASPSASGPGPSGLYHDEPVSVPGYAEDDNDGFPPIHTLPPLNNNGNNAGVESDVEEHDHELGFTQEAEVDELAMDDGREPEQQQQFQSGRGPRRDGAKRDARVAFFALLCAVLALATPAQGGEAGLEGQETRETMRALARRAAGVYLGGSPQADSDEQQHGQQQQGDTDALLALWVVALGMEGGDAYLVLAQAIAHARMAGLDSSVSTSALSPAPPLPVNAAFLKSNKPEKGNGKGKGIKTELDDEGEFGFLPHPQSQPGFGFDASERQRGGGGAGVGGAGGREEWQWVRALRARAWWAVVGGDLLIADALGLAPHVPLGSLSPPSLSPPSSASPSSSSSSDDDSPSDALASAFDWRADHADDHADDAATATGRGFGALVRFARAVHAVHSHAQQGGLEGACRAEEGVRGWVGREVALIPCSSISATSSTAATTMTSATTTSNLTTTNVPASFVNGSSSGMPMEGLGGGEFDAFIGDPAGFDFVGAGAGVGSTYGSAMDVDSSVGVYPLANANPPSSLSNANNTLSLSNGAKSPSNATGKETEAGREKLEFEQEKERTKHALELLANRVVLGVWVGWVAWSPANGNANGNAPSAAVYGAVNAAHGVVTAASSLTNGIGLLASSTNGLLASSSNANGLLASSSSRALFDAGVVCAWAAIRHPTSAFAAGAREGLGVCVRLFGGGEDASASPSSAHSSAPAHLGGEAVRVLEGLARRAGVLPALPAEANNVNVNVHNQGTIRINGHNESPSVPQQTLKRKHEAMAGGSARHQEIALEAHPQQQQQQPQQPPHPHPQHSQSSMTMQMQMQQQSPPKPDKLALAMALKEKEREREREREMGMVKEKKKRTGYPSVGIRVRPGQIGKESAAGSPVSPVSAGVQGSRRGSGKGPLALGRQAEEGYYPHQQQQPQHQQHQAQMQQQQQQQQHLQQHAQHQQSQMEAYRSRSSSISQDPRMQPPKDQQQQHAPPNDQQHVVAMAFTMPFSTTTSSSSVSANPNATDGGEYRRAFVEPPPAPMQQMAPPQHQQQGYAGDSASAVVFDLPRAGSYEAEAAYGAGGGGSVGSPYGNSSSAGGAMSAASSPYTNTSGGVSTPTFGAGNGSGNSHPSPPYAASPRFAPQPSGGAYYHTPGTGYDAPPPPQQQQQYVVGDAMGYDVKPLPPQHQHHAHAHGQYAQHEPPRHDMAWSAAEPVQAQHQPPYWPPPTQEYMAYSQ